MLSTQTYNSGSWFKFWFSADFFPEHTQPGLQNILFYLLQQFSFLLQWNQYLNFFELWLGNPLLSSVKWLLWQPGQRVMHKHTFIHTSSYLHCCLNLHKAEQLIQGTGEGESHLGWWDHTEENRKEEENLNPREKECCGWWVAAGRASPVHSCTLILCKRSLGKTALKKAVRLIAEVS